MIEKEGGGKEEGGRREREGRGEGREGRRLNNK